MTDEAAMAAVIDEDEGPETHGTRGMVNLGDINAKFSAGETVNLASLQAKGMIDPKVKVLKVLGTGTIDKPLTVEAQRFSASAVKMIVLAGGKAVKKR